MSMKKDGTADSNLLFHPLIWDSAKRMTQRAWKQTTRRSYIESMYLKWCDALNEKAGERHDRDPEARHKKLEWWLLAASSRASRTNQNVYCNKNNLFLKGTESTIDASGDACRLCWHHQWPLINHGSAAGEILAEPIELAWVTGSNEVRWEI